MKKICSLALVFLLALSVLAGCGAGGASSSQASSAPGTGVGAGIDGAQESASASAGQELTESEIAGAVDPTALSKTDYTAMRIASLKGPTTMGLVRLMADAGDGVSRHDYQVTMYGAADEIAPQLIKGDIDIALVPCNLASVLYNKTEGQVQLAAVNTLGVLYIVTTGDGIKTVADLKGKTIYATGKGTTPEYVLNYILQENGLVPGKDVTIEYKSEATEVLAAMQTSSGYPIAMLPQPYVTTAQMQMEGLNVALDLTAEWNKVSPDSALVTGVAVARKDFIEKNKVAFDEFLEDYAASVEWVQGNNDKAAELVASYGIVPKAEIAKKALPACNLTFLTGKEMKAKAAGYLQVLYDQDPASVGGKLPDDAFYYGA